MLLRRLIVLAAAVLAISSPAFFAVQPVAVAQQVPCVDDLAARPKAGKSQLTWTPTGAHHYNIYRGTVSGGPYLKIATAASYSTYLDSAVVNGTTYYYVVRPATLIGQELCQSNEAKCKPSGRPGRT